MSLTRKALAAMGIEEAQADEIIKMHLDTVNPIKDERDTLKAKEARLEAVQGELDELKKTIKDGDRSPYKAKYEEAEAARDALQKEFDDYKADVETKQVLADKKAAYRKLLVEAGVSEKRLDSVMRLAEVDGKLDGIEIEEGRVKGDDALESVKADYADYIVTAEPTGATTPNPPTNNVPDINSPSRATLMAQQYHANLYGANKEE